MKNGQTEQNQGVRLDFVCPVRTKVRRAAKFVRSIKHKKFLISDFYSDLWGSAVNLQSPLIYIVLYGLRFFYIPIFMQLWA